MSGELYAEVEGAGPRLVLVHGFTQSGRAWGPVRPALAERGQVVALDAPGHGRSAAVEAGLWDGAALMVAAAGPEPATWIGYSMGGRFALHVALAHPAAVSRLVLVSATAGIDDDTQRAERRLSDSALAERVEREGLEPFLRWWLAQPLFSTLPRSAAQLEGRLDGTAAGLASSLRRAGTGSQDPLWDRLGAITVPVLVVAGALDTRYAGLGRRIASSIGPNATLAVIEGAGHACHLEQPGPFLDRLRAWLG